MTGARLIYGSGGMGKVYEAEEISTGRRVALKLVSAEYAGAADAVERFRQEGRLASVIAHPRCVFVLAADEEAGRPYIVMELMPGRTLKDLVDERGPMAPHEAVARILDVIDGLAEAHRVGLIHRDVKPSNCFLDPEGRVKVGDFGLSKSLLGSDDGAPPRAPGRGPRHPAVRPRRLRRVVRGRRPRQPSGLRTEEGDRHTLASHGCCSRGRPAGR